MIDILIDDDNKVSIKTTNGITETEIASTIVIEAMRNLTKPEQDVESKLVLVAYDPTCKLAAVKEVKEKLDLGLKEAKDLVDECVGRKNGRIIKGIKVKNEHSL